MISKLYILKISVFLFVAACWLFYECFSALYGSQGCLKGPLHLGTGDRQEVVCIWGELQVPPSTFASSALLFFCMVGFHLAFCLKKGFCYQKKALKITPQGWFVTVIKLLQIKLLPYMLQCRIGVYNLKMLSETAIISCLASLW